MSLSTWDSPSGAYTSQIPPGMAAFRRVVAGHFGYSRTEVVRDKSRCMATKSEHCECGACDFFTTVVSKGRTLFDWCVAHADALGIQSVIFDRRVVGFGDPRERRYTGPSPHTDHVHIGLNRWARTNLTEDMVQALLPGQEDDLPYSREELKDIVREVLDEKPSPGPGTRGLVYLAWKALFKKTDTHPSFPYEEHLNIIERKIDAK